MERYFIDSCFHQFPRWHLVIQFTNELQLIIHSWIQESVYEIPKLETQRTETKNGNTYSHVPHLWGAPGVYPPPPPGPTDTPHLYSVRLSRLEKVGSAMVTLRASQGQRKWGKRSQQHMNTATVPDLSVCVSVLLGCSSAAMSVRDVIPGLFIRG